MDRSEGNSVMGASSTRHQLFVWRSMWPPHAAAIVWTRIELEKWVYEGEEENWKVGVFGSITG